MESFSVYFFFSIHKGFSCWILEWRSYVSIIVVMSTSPLFCYSFSSIVLLIHVIKVLNIIKLYMKNPRVWIRYSHKAYTLTFILSSVCTWYLSMKSANIKFILWLLFYCIKYYRSMFILFNWTKVLGFFIYSDSPN